MEITVRGSYPDLLGYLAALEKLPSQMFWSKAALNVGSLSRINAYRYGVHHQPGSDMDSDMTRCARLPGRLWRRLIAPGILLRGWRIR